MWRRKEDVEAQVKLLRLLYSLEVTRKFAFVGEVGNIPKVQFIEVDEKLQKQMERLVHAVISKRPSRK